MIYIKYSFEEKFFYYQRKKTRPKMNRKQKQNSNCSPGVLHCFKAIVKNSEKKTKCLDGWKKYLKDYITWIKPTNTSSIIS